jgi:hypothetical protein
MLTLSYQCLNIILTTKALVRSQTKQLGSQIQPGAASAYLRCISTEADDHRQMNRQVCGLGMPLTTKMKPQP